MKNRRLFVLLAMSMFVFSGCSNGADGQNAAKSNVSASKVEMVNVTDNVSDEEESDASEEEPEKSTVETNQTDNKATAEPSSEEAVDANGMEIESREVSVAVETEPTETVSELPSTDLCVGLAKDIFDATNAERVAAGLPEFVWSDELAVAADIRAEEIITEFSHVRPNGEKCYSLGSNIHGENIARGPHATGAEFVEHWMDSPGHKENILREEVFTAIGIGVRNTEMGDTAVQIFGTY